MAYPSATFRQQKGGSTFRAQSRAHPEYFRSYTATADLGTLISARVFQVEIKWLTIQFIESVFLCKMQARWLYKRIILFVSRKYYGLFRRLFLFSVSGRE